MTLSKPARLILKIFLIILGLLILFRLFLPSINSPAFQQFSKDLGIWGYLVIILYIVFSHVLAPVAGSPGVALGITVYGIHIGAWLLYIGSMISATINFYISKRFGRRWVEKLAGKESMEQIDKFAALEGREVLIFSRVFGFSLFDFVSYAAGLTSIRYREYMVITAMCNLIPNLIMQYVFRDIDFGSPVGVAIWGASILAVAIVFGLILNIYVKRKKSSVPPIDQRKSVDISISKPN